MFTIKIIVWSHTDYSFLVNNDLGYVSDDQKYYVFESADKKTIMEQYLNGSL